MRKLKIAMIGQKGMPARYGGVETHVEQVATRLASRGHEVWAFCRDRFMPGRRSVYAESGYAASDDDSGGLRESGGAWTYRGVRLVGRPSLNTKHLDAASHTFLCAVESVLMHDFDIVHFHGIGPSAFAFIPVLAGKTVVSTVHALDWRQAKWGTAASWFLKKGERLGVWKSTGVIAVSRLLADYLGVEYGVRARYIPNGAIPGTARPAGLIRRFGLEGDDYVLAVGRIIPDRGLHDLIKAFSLLETDLKLVIVGSETPRTSYSTMLEKMAGEGVIFTGNQFGPMLEELYSNCRLYVLASSVEGLPITVCEAMAYGRGMLLSDIPENSEVAADAAIYYKCSDVNSLHNALKVLVDDRETLAALGRKGRARVEKEYNWDVISTAVEEYYLELISR